MADFHIVKDDDAPPVEAVLTNSEGELALLGGASVAWVMTAMRGGDGPKVNRAAEIVDDNAASVRFQWQSPDLDTAGGFYAHWFVTYANGTTERFPNDRNLTIAIHHDLLDGSQTPGVVLLASTAQLAEARHVDHDPSDVKALRALEDASSMFRALAHQTISFVEDDQVELRGGWSHRMYLPERPVIDVTAATVVWPGTSEPQILEADSWRFLRSGLLTYCGDWGGEHGAIRVTYSHGYEEIPGDVVGTVISIAIRKLQNPAGVLSEQIGTHSVTYQSGAIGSQSVGLSSEDLAIIKRYRPLL